MIKGLPNLYSFLHLTQTGLNKILDKIDKYYKPKREPKKKYGEYQRDNRGRIKYRDLLVPIYPLKLAQQRINDLLQNIDLPDYMFGSIPKRNHIINAQQHLNQTHFLAIDLKKFFPNINHFQVHEMFLNQGFSHAVSHILTKLTTHQKSLPQGAPTSPVIANLVFLNTAQRLFEFAKTYNLTFTNYLDDQSFSSKKSFKELVPQILAIIKQNKFFPAHDKIHYRINRCEITGLIVNGNKLQLMPEMTEKARTNIHLKAYVNLVKKYNHQQKN